MKYGHRWPSLLAATLVLAAIVGCGGGSRSGLAVDGATAAQVGTRQFEEFPAGFDILPPINQPKTGLGALNEAAAPILEVYTGSEAAKGTLVTRKERPDITVVDGHFQYDWDTNASSGGLPAGTTNCVIEVSWGATLLGYADCVIDKVSGKGKKANDPEFFDLHLGRTLSIKFIVDDTVPPPITGPPINSWDAYSDFSTSQGALGVWYYEYFLASSSTYGNLVYGHNVSSSYNEWYSPTPPSASFGQPRILHDLYTADAAGLFLVVPGDNDKRLDAVFKWVAPHAGTFVVSGTIKGVYESPSFYNGYGGDGFAAHLLVNGVEQWSLDVPSYGPPTTIPPLSVALGSGDVVRLHIDHKTSTYYDYAATNLTVTEY